MSKQIIFFDTETTGNTEEDFLCQIAYKTEDTSFSEMYKPPKTIPPEASAVHHISNDMIKDKPIFQESKDFETIKNLFENENSIPVAHNAMFDLFMIKKENIVPSQFICTLRVAKKLDPEQKLQKYNLQYLRYALGIEIEATAHDALGDVLVLEKLFERLKKKIMTEENTDENTAIQKMIEISSVPFLFKTLPFGKYKDMPLEEIAQKDQAYLEWLLAQKEKNGQLDEDWIYTLKTVLKK
ncbi:MAG: 3'-5' exonuclease [Candidatus Pacebacteria bacterium]|nr:3'-5' exonuclease [Candidatus Paceibacterota bacterium]MCF7863044.1 3'-5' exonuclease [Candidatus Paceibacterota bacterium]